MCRQMTFASAEAKAKLEKIRIAIADRPMTVIDIMNAINVSNTTASLYVRHLRAGGYVHICGYIAGCPPTAIYKLGNCEDARKPTSMSVEERDRKYRKVDVEDCIKAKAKSRAKRIKPHRDALVQAFFGSVAMAGGGT